ncbi:pirin-like C-terminal cupin domain-containing protein [Methylomarinum sp. Ch1-1]|uniref:Pirin-like C-terminal cupin domain-containing protein n=1 Tax=Methylomarinum roseum TaxID=3067653 RepID=A0AAU7NWV8_9GAMM|nr:pirin-like C-terminal cupin domain-containing protein [Methylomarinum sp. Ch1-1]MDP4522488.1 pirin-like C-terminal cupin domain-containing protein [Methylomarinum sp. Ch1-1]
MLGGAYPTWLLSGEPIEESIVGRGSFVMNTQQEKAQAIDDFNSGLSAECKGIRNYSAYFYQRE